MKAMPFVTYNAEYLINFARLAGFKNEISSRKSVLDMFDPAKLWCTLRNKCIDPKTGPPTGDGIRRLIGYWLHTNVYNARTRMCMMSPSGPTTMTDEMLRTKFLAIAEQHTGSVGGHGAEGADNDVFMQDVNGAAEHEVAHDAVERPDNQDGGDPEDKDVESAGHIPRTTTSKMQFRTKLSAIAEEDREQKDRRILHRAATFPSLANHFNAATRKNGT